MVNPGQDIVRSRRVCSNAARMTSDCHSAALSSGPVFRWRVHATIATADLVPRAGGAWRFGRGANARRIRQPARRHVRPGPTSGQFIAPTNGRVPPFVDQQPVQGVSSVLRGPDGDLWIMADNGFGAKENSPDFVLRMYRVSPDFKTTRGGSGDVDLKAMITLSDPRRRINFPIVADQDFYPGSTIPVDPAIRASRLLTGGDFDIESVRGRRRRHALVRRRVRTVSHSYRCPRPRARGAVSAARGEVAAESVPRNGVRRTCPAARASKGWRLRPAAADALPDARRRAHHGSRSTAPDHQRVRPSHPEVHERGDGFTGWNRLPTRSGI